MRLEGRKALVTGASRGIGRAISLAFADEGADVAATARSLEALEETWAEIEARGRRCHAMAWDVRDVSQAEQRLEDAAEALGGLDIVVNNAGVHHLPDGPDGRADSEAEWDYVMDTNLKAVWFITEAAARMMAREGGAVVNIASDYAFRGANTIYGVSKWGVAGLTRGLARNWAGRGVRINAIGPGPVATEMIGWEEGDALESDHLPLGRLTLPDEVARVAVFLASDDASALIGETIVLNTGNP
ncbi:MAG: SDR family oxidoreductase [Armatimonadota bacterium]|nr:SDR family oxidoreductase [Armatimonadota bacterium]